MSSSDELAEVMDRYHAAAIEFVKGDPAPYVALWSTADDVTLANPFGPPVRGWAVVRPTMERAAENWRDGELVGFENVSTVVTPELAYVVEIESFNAKMGGSSKMSPVALRTTSVLRREEGTWKIIHRHADTITTPRGGDSVVG